MRRVLGIAGAVGLAAGLVMGAAPAGAATKTKTPVLPKAGAIVSGESTRPVDASRVRCDEGHWPLTVQGEPAGFDPGDRAGYRVWHDGPGWHLRTTTPSTGDTEFTGVIRSADAIEVVAEYHDESGDTVHVDGNVITFDFHTHNGVDGLDFVVGCTDHVSFNLRANGDQVPADRVWLGRTGRAPGNPFTVFRGK